MLAVLMSENSPNCSLSSDKASWTTNQSLEKAFLNESLNLKAICPFELAEPRFYLYQSEITTCEISQKLSQKAVSWIMTICWSKNIQPECLWLTIMLYYSFKAKRSINKNDLELILLSSLHLAVKMHSTTSLKLVELASLASKKIEVNQIKEMERIILEIVDFDLVIPNTLEIVFKKYQMEPKKLVKILFLCELYMIKDYRVFLEGVLMDKLVQMAEQQMSSEHFSQELKAIRHFLSQKEYQVVKQKYQSKFDPDQFLDSFQ